VVIFGTVTITVGDTAGGWLDTKGYDFANVLLWHETCATNKEETQILWTEADATDGTTSAIVALTGGTATSTSVGYVIANSPTVGQWKQLYRIDCRGRKRYLNINITAVTTITPECVAFLGKGEIAGDGTTENGCANVVSA